MIVISDMMGTLTTGSPFLGLVDWVRHNQSKWQARFYTAKAMPAYILAKNGLIDWQEFGQRLMVESLAYIKHADEAKMQHAAEWAVEHNLWKKRREDVIARLVRHREQGAKVYIASSSVEPFVKSFAARFGAEAIGTPVQIINGRVGLAGELVASDNKIGQVLSRLGVERLDFAYGDTEQDIPLLEHADHPVAVYPDKNLKQAALERGWEIIGDTPKYG
jgi:phosphoserine phosphatase